MITLLRSVFAALRVSALWSSSMIIFTLVAILALLPLTISIVCLLPLQTCHY